MEDTRLILEKTAQFVCCAMGQNDPAHDENHARRVVALTKQLCEYYPEADPFRAQLLAWLHDMSDDKLSSNMGAASIADFLRGIGTAEEDIAFVLTGIPYISYRKYPKLDPEIPLEIRIVQDADRMDAMGAIGIARTFAYGGAKDRPLEESLAHFDEKLLLLYDLLSTDAAKALAAKRRELLQTFYKEYKAEEGGF